MEISLATDWTGIRLYRIVILHIVVEHAFIMLLFSWLLCWFSCLHNILLQIQYIFLITTMKKCHVWYSKTQYRWPIKYCITNFYFITKKKILSHNLMTSNLFRATENCPIMEFHRFWPDITTEANMYRYLKVGTTVAFIFKFLFDYWEYSWIAPSSPFFNY